MLNSPPDHGNGKPQQDAAFSLEDAVDHTLRHARRLVVAVVGGTVVLAGIVMLVTPGPAMVLIPAGLAILAVEFAWARRLLKRVRSEIKDRIGRQSPDDRAPRGHKDDHGTGGDNPLMDSQCQK